MYRKQLMRCLGASLIAQSVESACSAGDLGLIPGSGRSPWIRKWQPTPVFLPGESHGWRSLVGYSPWVRKQSDTTEGPQFHPDAEAEPPILWPPDGKSRLIGKDAGAG